MESQYSYLPGVQQEKNSGKMQKEVMKVLVKLIRKEICF
jgi:hypothetical protein